MQKNTLPEYRYGAARTMAHLRGQYLLAFLSIWKQAKENGIVLPESDHPGYISLVTLLRHAFSADRHYLLWICEKLGLPDPEIDPLPELDIIESQADSYIAHLIECWREPLANVEESQFNQPEYPSNWGVHYCIDAMLEHAVMHPILHRVQLLELLAEQLETRKTPP